MSFLRAPDEQSNRWLVRIFGVLFMISVGLLLYAIFTTPWGSESITDYASFISFSCLAFSLGSFFLSFRKVKAS
jgi:hypothetical protein